MSMLFATNTTPVRVVDKTKLMMMTTTMMMMLMVLKLHGGCGKMIFGCRPVWLDGFRRHREARKAAKKPKCWLSLNSLLVALLYTRWREAKTKTFDPPQRSPWRNKFWCDQPAWSASKPNPSWGPSRWIFLEVNSIWLVVDLPLWKIWVRELGLWFPICGK